MKITHEKLPHSRHRFVVEIEIKQTDQFFSRALKNLAPTVKVQGFRPGKAPEAMLRERIGADKLREEAYTIAVRESWQQIVKRLAKDELPIHDPEVNVEKFEEGQAAKIVFAFDVRPRVKLGDWRKIKVKTPKGGTKGAATREEVERTLKSLAKAHAKTILKLEGAQKGDQVLVNFEGSIAGVRKDKLSGRKFPVIIGAGAVLPGFEDQLVGLKRGGKRSFVLNFPADHFDREFAGSAVKFEVEVEEVFRVIEPAIDDSFAEKFGHKKLSGLRAAIEKDLLERREEEVFVQQRAKWLADFERLVTTELPDSLIEAEVARSRENWQKFLAERLLEANSWLKARGITMEQLEADWQRAATSSVKIGLGLAEVARQLKRDLGSNEDFQKLLDELVRKAIS